MLDFMRNSEFDANSFFSNRNGVPLTSFKRNQFGADFSGPIRKDKTFFLFDYAGLRERSASSFTSTVPTALERQGNFSQTRDNTGNLYPYIRDYAKGLPCNASNTAGCFQYNGVVGWIPPDRLYAPGVAILNNKYWPLPNHTQQVGENYNYEATQPKFKSPTYQPSVRIDYPPWVHETIDWDAVYRTDEERMRLAIAVSRENVERDTGGPFGAAIFESESGRLVAVGMNSVVRLNNCTLHGEMVAFMMAQARVRSYTLNASPLPAHELVTSCEPCAMCLGATLWSGVRRLVYGAGREDASQLRFDEGPVFPESYRYLEERGITIVRNVLRSEATAVLERYRAKGGAIYNA
jgi:tRNA(Arg) A34 adenosine deaminase TadA